MLSPLPPVDDRTEAFMLRKRREWLDDRVRADLAKSQRRGAKRVLVSHADLESLLAR